MSDGKGALEADDRLLFAVTTGMAQEGYNCDVLLYCEVLGNGDWGCVRRTRAFMGDFGVKRIQVPRLSFTHSAGSSSRIELRSVESHVWRNGAAMECGRSLSQKGKILDRRADLPR